MLLGERRGRERERGEGREGGREGRKEGGREGGRERVRAEGDKEKEGGVWREGCRGRGERKA